MDPRSSSASLATPRRRWLELAFLFGFSAWLAGRLLLLVNKYAVNVLFWDQWDFYEPLFRNNSLWSIFTYRHGPHRQGLGGLMIKLMAESSGWNTRAEILVACVLTCLSAAAALLLKKRLFGRLNWTDIVPALIILSPMQWEIYFMTSNPSHGTVPLLLLLLCCLAWTLRNRPLRYLLVVVCTFLSTFTGFGVFLGVITPVVLILECLSYAAKKRYAELPLPLAALAACAGSTALFFHGYICDAAVENFRFPDPQYYLYPQCMALSMAFACGMRSYSLGTMLVGWPVMLASLSGATIKTVQWLRAATEPARIRSMVIVILLGFSLVFAANMAVGRLCLGVTAGMCSRYLPLLMPLGVGLYFCVLTIPKKSWRYLLLAVLLVITLRADLRIHSADRDCIKESYRGKLGWVAAYKQTKDVEEANRRSNFKVYPEASRTRLKEKLDFLEANRLNLFRE